MTNLEKIRSLDSDELARFLVCVNNNDGYFCIRKGKRPCFACLDCNECVEKWLNEEVNPNDFD